MFFFLLTNLVGFMQDFLLGTFGYFAYPIFILVFLGGVALLNNKKYKLSKKVCHIFISDNLSAFVHNSACGCG